MKKYLFLAFQGNQMCFMHLLLYAIDLHEKGMEAKIIMEGEATKLIKELEANENKIYLKAKELNIFDSICKACSAKMGVLEYNETVGIPIKGELSGHPSIFPFVDEGYELITL